MKSLKINSLFKFVCLLVMTMCIVASGISFGASVKKTIVSLETLSVETQHLQPYSLPKSVVATMNDKSKQTVLVQWTPNKADTTKIGTTTYTGTVKGTKATARLMLKVVPSIVSIKETTSQISVNAEVQLPSQVEVVLSNQKTEMKPVKWSPTSYSTDSVGTFTTTGAVEGTKIPAKHTSKIMSRFDSIENLTVTIPLKEAYMLPSEVPAKQIDGTILKTPIKWLIASPALDTRWPSSFTIEGKAIGYEKTVRAFVTIQPVIEPIEDKVITLFTMDTYSIPNEINVKMNDGTTKLRAISWTSPLPDLKISGKYELLGKVDGYEKPVKYTYIVKSSFFTKQKTTYYNEWGNIQVNFSKLLSSDLDPKKIKLVNNNGVRIAISELKIGYTQKMTLLIIPSRILENGAIYTLTIPANSIKSIDGETNEEDIVYVFSM